MKKYQDEKKEWKMTTMARAPSHPNSWLMGVLPTLMLHSPSAYQLLILPVMNNVTLRSPVFSYTGVPILWEHCAGIPVVLKAHNKPVIWLAYLFLNMLLTQHNQGSLSVGHGKTWTRDYRLDRGLDCDMDHNNMYTYVIICLVSSTEWADTWQCRF